MRRRIRRGVYIVGSGGDEEEGSCVNGQKLSFGLCRFSFFFLV